MDEKDQKISDLEGEVESLKDDVKAAEKNASEFEMDRDAAYQALQEIKDIANKLV